MSCTPEAERWQYLAYLRKSRYDRDYAELSVEDTLRRHEEILNKLARERGYFLAATYREVVSGESIAARPEIQKLLEAVSTGTYAGVLVVDVERLARGNSADQAYISQVFKYSSTKIITPQKDYDPNDEFDEEYFEFGLYMSRREYKTINRRLVRGRQSSAAEGKYVGSIAPYGYTRVKLPEQKGYSLAPDPAEAEVVRRIYALYLRRIGTKQIANELNDRGIPTRHGAPWTYSTVANILSNPVYLGKIRRGYCKEIKSIDENGRVKSRIRHLDLPDYQLYEGIHPAIIDEDSFRQVQALRAERSPGVKLRHGSELQNSFSGLIYCAVCGRRISRTVSSKSRGAEPRLRCENSRSCHNASASYSVVEREIIAALRSWLDGYRVRIETAELDNEITDCRRLLAKAEQESLRLRQQLDRASDLVEQGVYSLSYFQQRQAKLWAELAAADADHAAAEQKLRRLEDGKSSRGELIPRTEALLDSYESMTPEERNRLLKLILDRIEYRKDKSGRITVDLYPRLPRA